MRDEACARWRTRKTAGQPSPSSKHSNPQQRERERERTALLETQQHNPQPSTLHPPRNTATPNTPQQPSSPHSNLGNPAKHNASAGRGHTTSVPQQGRKKKRGEKKAGEGKQAGEKKNQGKKSVVTPVWRGELVACVQNGVEELRDRRRLQQR